MLETTKLVPKNVEFKIQKREVTSGFSDLHTKTKTFPVIFLYFKGNYEPINIINQLNNSYKSFYGKTIYASASTEIKNSFSSVNNDKKDLSKEKIEEEKMFSQMKYIIVEQRIYKEITEELNSNLPEELTVQISNKKHNAIRLSNQELSNWIEKTLKTRNQHTYQELLDQKDILL